jgi:hypothetical protein
MPEVVRGSRPSVDITRSHSGNNEQIPRRGVHFDTLPQSPLGDRPPLVQADSTGSRGSRDRRISQDEPRKLERRRTDKYEDRPTADAYYDSRAASRKEFKRRASTLAEYYQQRPDLLPQLPFTFRHGWRRWKLFGLIFLIFVDACVIPIVLYYSMKFAGNVEGWISMFSQRLTSSDTYKHSSFRRCRHNLGRTNLRRIRRSIMAPHQKGRLLPPPRHKKQMGL